MQRIANKTQKPLSVPLPRGKTLHLGPEGLDRSPRRPPNIHRSRQLVHAGEIELFDGAAPIGGSGGGGKGCRSFHGHPANNGGRRSGDR